MSQPFSHQVENSEKAVWIVRTIADWFESVLDVYSIRESLRKTL
jgi:hypothetical protein